MQNSFKEYNFVASLTSVALLSLPSHVTHRSVSWNSTQMAVGISDLRHHENYFKCAVITT